MAKTQFLFLAGQPLYANPYIPIPANISNTTDVSTSPEPICPEPEETPSAKIKPGEIPTLDLFINEKRSEELKQMQSQLIEPIKQYMKSLDFETFRKIFKLLGYVSQPCFDIPDLQNVKYLLKRCEILGKEVNCSSIFRTVITDYGICCGANVQNILRESKYTTLVNEMDKTNTVEQQKLHPKVGKNNGLRLTIDKSIGNVDFGTVYEDYDAFQLYVGSSMEFPMMQMKSKVLSPGREHFVQLSSYIISADDDIKSISPEKRECFFPDERHLTLYKTYSFINCDMECKILQVESELGCVPWFLPKGIKTMFLIFQLTNCIVFKGDESSICDPWTAFMFQKQMEKVEVTESCNCAPDCSSITYTSSHTSSPFRFKAKFL